MTRSGLVLDDRYRLDEPIAAGGVGQVWHAADLLLERPVAVKLLRPEYADHPETLERFRAEAKHAGSLSHPCIARVYDYGHAGPSTPPYLVMEYVRGPSLADMLVVDPVDPVVAMDVVAQAAAGLDAAHRNGLVHRDVKPGNILIGEDGLVKITDFGIASAAGSAPITGPGLVMGTTQYLAPERIAGGPGTPASDLYSLGILIYECLTGMPPYNGTTAEVMAAHLYMPLPPLPPGVPPELGELVARLTAKDPAARLSDASELATVARRLRDTLAAGAGREAASPALAGPASPALAGVAVPDPAGHAAAGLWDDRPSPPGAPPPGALLPTRADRPPRAGRRRAAVIAAGATVLAGAGMAGLLASGALRDPPAADHAPASRHAAVPGAVAPGEPAASASPGAPGGSAGSGGPGGQRAGHGKTKHGGTGGGQGKKDGASSTPGSTPSAGQSGTPSPTPSSTPTGLLPIPLPLGL